MAASPVEHAEQARLALRTIVAEHGPATLSNPRTLSNLLADLLPDSPRLARLLVAAAQDRIADDLKEHTSDGMDAETAARLVASAFADATMFAPDACYWAVGEIALALGLRPEPEPGPRRQERFSATATARFVAAPEINPLPATEPASLSELEEAHRIPEPRREARPRPVWPRTAPDQASTAPDQAGTGQQAGAGQQADAGQFAGTGPQTDPDGESTVPPTLTWTATVTADRGYFDSVISEGHVEASSITFPEDCPPRSFTLTGPQLRIGRRSVSRGTTPEIDLSGPPLDPGISHLHALLVARDDGTWSVEDRGSSNGTQVNGDEIAVGVPVVLRDGDRISLGAWTVVTVRSS